MGAKKEKVTSGKEERVRNLVVVLGDQLNRDASAWDGFEVGRDRVWMAEVAEESEHVWTSQPRIVMFLAAMRHFAAAVRAEGVGLDYTEVEAAENAGTLGGELARAIARRRPERMIVTQPGDYRVLQALEATAEAAGVVLEVREDRHFFCTLDTFRRHADGRKGLRMEFFYREQRRAHGVLLDKAGEPEGGQWNFDHDNRGSFGRAGPGAVPAAPDFRPDDITREVIAVVRRRFGKHPGNLESFAWPVTRAQALVALEDFVTKRLRQFGEFQDAMWIDEPWLWHSLLSAALNVKLLNPREVVGAAEKAWRDGTVPLASAEGFIRQILGWREYVRGIYWRYMPDYGELNKLGAQEALPEFYWTGKCEMNCLRQSLGQTLEHGYAHHIQRLMVTGLYPLLLGVKPQAVHAWYLAVHVDAVEWVELPNTLGMSQYGDGGLMASKPYVATGKYIQRMSNYCTGCRFDPAERLGERACPFTTLYWDFLVRHEKLLAGNPRMALQVKNAVRLMPAERTAIAEAAAVIRANGGEPRRAAARNDKLPSAKEE